MHSGQKVLDIVCNKTIMYLKLDVNTVHLYNICTDRWFHSFAPKC